LGSISTRNLGDEKKNQKECPLLKAMRGVFSQMRPAIAGDGDIKI